MMWLKKNIWIVLVTFFALAFAGMTARVLWHAPFWIPGDIFSYLGWSQSIIDAQKIEFLSLAQGPILYTFFPGLFILLAAGSLISGATVPVVTALTNVFYVAWLTLGLAAVGWFAFRDRRLSLVAAVLGTTFGGSYVGISTPNEVFPFLSTQNISFLFFLAAIVVYVRNIRRCPHWSWLENIPFFVLVTAAILIHPQSALFRGSIFGLASFIIALLARRGDRLFFWKMTLVSTLPWIIILSINLRSLTYFWNVGVGVAVENTLGVSAPAPARFYSNYGHLLFLFAIIGLLYLVFSRNRRREWSYVESFIIILTATVIALSYLDSLGIYFFGGRFLGELILPYVLLASLGAVAIVDVLISSRRLAVTIVTMYLAFSSVALLSVLSKTEFDFDWPSVRALSWANENLRNKKVLADPYTYYMFHDMGHLIPAYSTIRTLKNVGDNEAVQVVLVNQDADAAYRYLQRHQIEFVVIDTYFDPLWTGLSDKKFTDQRRYELVYSTEHQHKPGNLLIYRVR